MAGSGVIADVSRTLVATLDASLAALFPAPPPVARLVDLIDAIPAAPETLAVFLYEVNEDASARNRPKQRVRIGANWVLRKPPMALTLHYMVVPFAGDRLTEQRMMGAAMQTIYDDSIFSGSELVGEPSPAGLLGSDVALSVTLDPLNVEERTRVFNSVQRQYRLSLAYQVRVANIDPLQDRNADLVRSRNFDPAVPVDS